jgi:hypothetical protein
MTRHSGSYTVDAHIDVERGVEENAVPIATSGDHKTVDLHASVYEKHGLARVMLYAEVESNVHAYVRIDLEDALWLAQQIIAAGEGVPLPKAIEV